MGRRTNKSVIGDFRGQIGPTVFREVRGIGVAQQMPAPRGKEKLTDPQKDHLEPFGRITKFLQAAKEVINLGYQKPKNAEMNAFNAAVSWHFYNAMVDDPRDGTLHLEKLKLSSPIKKTQKAWEPQLSVDDDYVTVAWKLNPSPLKCTQLDDKAVIVMHYHDRGRPRFICHENAAKREDLNFTQQVHLHAKGQDTHWYMFLRSADKKLVSDTQYLGKLKIKA